MAQPRENPTQLESKASQLLHESRRARAWARLKSLLDAGREPQGVARHALVAGDGLAFEALAQELPDYLRAKGCTEPMVEAETAAVASIGEPLRNEPASAPMAAR